MEKNNTKRKLNTQELKSVNGGKKSTVKCLLGTGGSAAVGSAGGPIGFWGGGALGMATFC
ncbi:Blp family class II bacteriocin [Staphylococcus xylosus]|uniref:Blp family class II bacteriocin n=1 Tax=Staphylococcus xylosus TaxID=1288 RepID=UPI000852F1E7|nr:Blp family class II bacteriocin [Staphylococcus xylosus]MCA2500424.1 Blp family class II bacteriocin [Staphylococcus xylosus]MCA2502238.1 Blp family class II bacteriocin [Staphylococcus xylosus]MCD8851404.1 Blp family class II bacteriocin [Staphylococcus xylosus]MCE7780135.1 Blp family class II bacteriocin [Staphylococcus xylosus]MEB6319792.1 Blp family class II bacteriocin [Staphylococcus xylosus]